MRLQITVSNDVIELTFANDTERTLLTSMRNLVTGLVTELSLDMVFYSGGRHAQQPPWVVRPSGQYVFHPAHPAEPVRLVLPVEHYIAQCILGSSICLLVTHAKHATAFAGHAGQCGTRNGAA